MGLADPGSFRDPASRVVIDDSRVLRLLDRRGLEDWRALSETRFFKQAVEQGRLIPANEVEHTEDGTAAALEHPRLPVITYPYEWTFSMLQDAALLQLDLLEEALDAGLTIKDATPFNIQFSKGRPIFIDLGSFEQYREGEPWIAYQQFTRQFLFPLMLRAWIGIPFQSWLRGDMAGPTANEMNNLLPAWRKLSPAALFHVVLQARMERRFSGRAVRRELKEAGFGSDMIVANVRRLRRLVESLDWKLSTDGWLNYPSCGHVARDRTEKGEFLTAALERVRPRQVVDLGANDGYFSKISLDHGAHAIAVDGDEAVLDDLYRHSSGREMSVVVTDLTDPSPSQGWAGVERPSLFQRIRPDLVIAFGLIHHLIYTSSIPPWSVIDWLCRFDCPVVVEFISPADEMVDRLVGNKLPEELHHGTDEQSFRDILSSRFDVISEHGLGSGTRILFELRPHGSPSARPPP